MLIKSDDEVSVNLLRKKLYIKTDINLVVKMKNSINDNLFPLQTINATLYTSDKKWIDFILSDLDVVLSQYKNVINSQLST
jgi:undecaprenyl pyrophosphate synthase